MNTAKVLIEAWLKCCKQVVVITETEAYSAWGFQRDDLHTGVIELLNSEDLTVGEPQLALSIALLAQPLNSFEQALDALRMNDLLTGATLVIKDESDCALSIQVKCPIATLTETSIAAAYQLLLTNEAAILSE